MDLSELTSGFAVAGLQDWGKAEWLASKAFMPHSLEPVSAREDLRVNLRVADLGVLRLGELGHGTGIIARCTAFDGYAINIPVAGTYLSSTGGKRVACGVGSATAFSYLEGSTIQTRPDTVGIGLAFEPGNLEAVLTKLLGRPVRTRIEFEPWLDLRFGRGAALLRTVQSARELVLRQHAPPELVLAQLGTVIATHLLLGVRHSYCDELIREDGPRALPDALEAAIDAIERDPTRPWSLADLAAEAHCSGRALQVAFRQNLDTTPLRFVRDVRLRRARAELAAPEGRSVTQIAIDCGFTHLGRFAAMYRNRYGLLPSQDYGRGS